MPLTQNHNNLTKAMHYFGSLDDVSRELFVKMVSNNTTEPTPIKRKAKKLAFEFTEDFYYQQLVAENPKMIAKHKEKYKNYQKN